MSHAANNYVKKLKQAPNGAAITATERALLWYLADGHNEEQGNFHFAGVKLLADHCGVGERQMRRIIRSVEESGIIARIYFRRSNGSHTANRYVFPALGFVCPDCSVSVAPMETHACIEQGKAQRKTQAAAFAGKNTRKAAKTAGGKSTENGANAVENPVVPAVTETVPSGHPDHEGGVSGDSTLRSPETDLATNLSTPLSTNLSPEADDYDDGEKVFPETASKAKTARANLSQPGGLTALRDIAKGVLPPSKWDEFKAELVRQLERLPEKLRADAMEVFETSIRDTALADEACDGDDLVPTWTIASADPEQTQNALNLLRANVKSALWKAAKQTVQVRVSGGGE